MVDNTLKFNLVQGEGDKVLSGTSVDYPAMPNGMANLFNIQATLALCNTALGAAIGKLEFINTDEPGREFTLPAMKQLQAGLVALLNPVGVNPSVPPGKGQR